MESERIRYFRELMRQLQRNLGWLSKSDAACCGVTVAQCHSLLAIGKAESINMIELANMLGLDTSTVSRTIDNMRRNQLVKRKANRKDRRYITLSLTDKGEKIYNNINCTFDSYYSKVFAAIPVEKHEQIIESIYLLTAALAEDENYTCCAEELS